MTLDTIQSKILNREQLASAVFRWKFFKQQIVFTNGCFDILHRGHIDYLSKARAKGNVLIIGLNTDASVSRIKGAERPLQDEYSRALLLASLGFVDTVVLFDEDTPFELIKQVKPDVLVKGADYKPEDIVGYDIVTESGGRVETIDFLPGFSTSSIVHKIKST
jgi:rfaE bifunctional protein nucleotidyltransferase chain/domain